jgi:2-octaprenyl-6-methoxyphenol hydroxylase
MPNSRRRGARRLDEQEMTLQHDIVIIGGGPIGLACAALLATRRIGSCVIDALPLARAQTDGRLLALSRGSWELLEPLLGDGMGRRAPIREVQVTSSGDFGATRISAADFGGADLGATMFYGDLLAGLAAHAATQATIEIRRPAQALDVRQRPDHVEVLLADGTTVHAKLAVRAEGNAGTSPTAEDDRAIVGDIRLRPTRPDLQPGAAFERFTRSGPLALLPTPAGTGDRPHRTLAMVWCMTDAEAARRMALNDAELIAELQAEIGARIGVVTSIGGRRAIALPRSTREQVAEHRVVALGNAAQTLHPVAGQGFNLGLRDCATLADELCHSGLTPEALSRYARRRRADRAAIALLTRAMPALFATRLAPLAIARGLGLALLDAAPPLRRELASLLMFGVRA